MSDSSGFSGTITGGIQDISALLPLLGTEQCEQHVGSALERGFLYSSFTPISIFGSLGIVRAAFNILVSSVNIPHYRVLGASKLSDGGFSPIGVVAPMISIDPKHPQRFLVETTLEAMLAEEHIENVEDLTVSWGEGFRWWNFFLITSTLIISSIGLLPYIPIVLDFPPSSPKGLFPLGFGFPIVRVVGSAICVTVAQFLIQIRILVILRERMLFITLDRLAKQRGIDLGREANPIMGHDALREWDSEVASEKCIWALRTWLSTNLDEERPYSQVHVTNEIHESLSNRQDPPVPRWVKPISVCLLLLGCISTVVGYVGCFYLIQQSGSSKGPLLWLVLEALLSIARIFAWAINPNQDDSKGILFKLRLASHAPLITCNKFESDFVHDGVAPLTRSDRFLEEVVAYTGPFSTFVAPDVTLYYILMAKGERIPDIPDSEPLHGMLYIVLSDHKEQTSRILFKQRHGDAFSIYASSLEPVPKSIAINVRVDFSEQGRTECKTHFLTSDDAFMDRLGAHYDTIISNIQHACDLKGEAHVRKTWAMQKPRKDDAGQGDDIVEATGTDQGITLTVEDKAYLRQGQVERRWLSMYKQLEAWVELFITLYTKELLENVPSNPVVNLKNESVTIAQQHESNELEFLLIECRTILERILLIIAVKWNNYLTTNHEKMVKVVLQGAFNPGQGANADGQQHNDVIRKEHMTNRLSYELESLSEREDRARSDNRQNRLTVQMKLTEQRVRGRPYTDTTGEVLIRTWKDLPGDMLLLEAAGTSDLTARDVDITAMWKDDFTARLQTRYGKTVEDVNNRKDSVDRSKQLSEVEQMHSSCCQRADQLFSRLEVHMTEFKDYFHVNDFSIAKMHEFVNYWSDKSLQERLRLQDRTQRYLRVTDESIEAVGGRENILRALKGTCAPVKFIDMHESNLLTVEDIKSVVALVPSVTGVASLRDGQEIYKAVMANVRASVGLKHDTCLFANLFVIDHDRIGEPYLLFAIPGASLCDIYFYIQTRCDHEITLRHCTKRAKVTIKLNGRELNEFWRQTEAAQVNFTDEDIFLPKVHLKEAGQPNVLQIILDDKSNEVYWLADVLLPVRPVQVYASLDATTT